MAKRKRKAREAAAEGAAEQAQVLEPEDGEEQAPVDAGAEEEGPSSYELERQRIIQRNRERLAALGIPALAASLERAVEATGAAGRKPKAARKKTPKAKREAGEEEEQPMRRSARIQQQHLSEEERLELDLGRMAEEGVCPRCGEAVPGAPEEQRGHLEGCQGPQQEEPQERPPPRPQRTDVEMTAEERRDVRRRTLARMKQLSLDNLVELSGESAKFVVLGSTGNHYVVTLADGKHTCECMDYRFRRHHCKHICLVLSHLGILDNPTAWHQAAEGKLTELARGEGGAPQGPPEAQAPLGKEAEVALRLL